MNSHKTIKFTIAIFFTLSLFGSAFALKHDLPPGREIKGHKQQKDNNQENNNQEPVVQNTPTTTKRLSKKRNGVKKSSPSYNVLNNWNLISSRPYVVLRMTNGSNLSIMFIVNNDTFEIPDEQRAIPANTRFTVPNGYIAYCNPYHTKMMNGKAQRVDYAPGIVKHKYEAGTEVEYMEASGLILISYADDKKKAQVVPSSNHNKFQLSTISETLDLLPEPKKTKTKTNFDNRSTNPEDVIKTYGLPDDKANFLLRRHKEIAKMLSKTEKIEKYAELFAYYDGDYLAAYYAGLVEIESGHGSRAKDWLEKSLKINPQYLPAKLLMKQANGLMKGV